MANVDQLEIEIIQPWSDILMKVKLPQMVVDAMLDITNQVLQDPDRENLSVRGDGIAQIAQTPNISHELMQNYKIEMRGGTVFHFFMDCIKQYIKTCLHQASTPFGKSFVDSVKNIEWLTDMRACWCNSQWTGEYIPLHIHSECSISTIMYLKVPEFLPSINPVGDDDGCITFLGGAPSGTALTHNLLKLKPIVGDFYIFPSHFYHTVYPFKTDGNFERRSVSFNSTFINKAELEKG